MRKRSRQLCDFLNQSKLLYFKLLFCGLIFSIASISVVFGEAGSKDKKGSESITKEARPSSVPALQFGSMNTNQAAMIDNETYIIRVGDKLDYQVKQYPSDRKLLTVSPSGEIEVPQLGWVHVAGKSVGQAARELKIRLEREVYYEAKVLLSVESIAASVQPASVSVPKPKKVIIVGQVRSPGIQEIPPDEKYTVSLAILRAGGFASFANGKKVQIVRRDHNGIVEKIEVDVSSIYREGKIDNDLELQPDDLVIVPEKFINF